uniref:Ribonuclease VapC n=1 Tax=Candidatus Kentrum sp. DK TaxID=2126562 RepID=A0A450SJN8_9GAMM|nr:MAG: PIN domain nuclease, a component of toxin-antitoxin system (PIN domain) [Candidatus Kentron sp. DK]VFJ57420.1 MAG: PIN domain nuclease, a component of toxin-antitoxin system (PIN domain) [Candidatus Kentron sp. DK]
MMLLDTHIWIRWLSGKSLPRTILSLVETTDPLAISAISCWELVLLSKRNRIKLPLPADEWIERGTMAVGIQCLPLDERILVLAASLSEHHRDPADRMIIATAIAYDAELISFDAIFSDYATSSGLKLIA